MPYHKNRCKTTYRQCILSILLYPYHNVVKYCMTRPKALFASKTLSLPCLFQFEDFIHLYNWGDWKQKNTKRLMFLKKTLCKCCILNDFITLVVLNNQINLPFSHYPQLLSGAGVKILFESKVFSCFIKEYWVTAPLPHNPDICCKNLTHHIVIDKGKIDLGSLLPEIAGVILKSGDGRDSLFF